VVARPSSWRRRWRSSKNRLAIDIRYTGTGSFVTDLEAQLRAANPPDIALVPQPGLVTELARSGSILAVGTAASAALDANYSDQTRALGVVDGVPVGVPFQVSLKSLVWYRPEMFDQLGLEIPATLDELETLAQQVEDAGLAPWCLGIEAPTNTGWVATDWTEEMVLHLSGPDTYDAWVRGDIEFADDAIADAFTAFRQLALVAGRSAGGIAGVLRTPLQVSPLGLFGEFPECVLHRQASFVYGLMPPGLRFGSDGDVDFFVLPGAGNDTPAPLLIGSTVAVSFDERPEVAAVMTHLATPESTRVWAQDGGFLRPHNTGGLDEVSPVDRAALELLRAADIVRADASDAMPPRSAPDCCGARSRNGSPRRSPTTSSLRRSTPPDQALDDHSFPRC
jgi:alpha-glucoside transport system substrate-binding protein